MLRVRAGVTVRCTQAVQLTGAAASCSAKGHGWYLEVDAGSGAVPKSPGLLLRLQANA